MLLDVDYFADDAIHSLKEFQRRFRVNKDLFIKIVFSKYFMIKQDCTGLWGFTSIHLNPEVHCCNALSCIRSSFRYIQ
jgi:hypothetical protein